MAIIICVECGKEFSNKAISCPNCGAPTSFSDNIKEKLVDSSEQYCSECGNSVAKDQSACTWCGNPIGRTGETQNQESVKTKTETINTAADTRINNVENAENTKNEEVKIINAEPDTQLNNIKNAENTKNEGKKSAKPISLWIVFIVILALSGFFYISATAGPKEAINLVKNYELNGSTIDDLVKVWVSNDTEVVQVYGWEAKKVSDNTYFVAYVFDDDNDKNNGSSFYVYEAELNSELVRSISDNPVLLEKYRELGFVE